MNSEAAAFRRSAGKTFQRGEKAWTPFGRGIFRSVLLLCRDFSDQTADPGKDLLERRRKACCDERTHYEAGQREEEAARDPTPLGPRDDICSEISLQTLLAS